MHLSLRDALGAAFQGIISVSLPFDLCLTVHYKSRSNSWKQRCFSGFPQKYIFPAVVKELRPFLHFPFLCEKCCFLSAAKTLFLRIENPCGFSLCLFSK